MMEKLGVPADFHEICHDIYDNAAHTIRSTAGNTPPIPLNQGIKQGCPLSPLLFNIVLEGLIPKLATFDGYRFQNGAKTSCLVFADDLCLLSSTTEEAQDMVQAANKYFDWAGLRMNAEKCGSLTMVNNRSRRFVAPFSPKIDEERSIPPLEWDDSYRYLGVQVGRESKQSLADLAESITTDAEKVGSSALAEWQKIDAIRTFILPRVSHLLESSLVPITWATKLDATIRRVAKKALRLPKRTICAFIHVPSNQGGLGIPSALDMLHIARVSRTVKTLNSKDKLVSDIAWSQLNLTIKQRRGLQDVTLADISDFLNNPPLPHERRTRDVQSLWSTVRKSLIHTSAALDVSNTGVTIRTGGNTPDSPAELRHPTALRRQLRQACEQRHLHCLLEAPDQGRTFATVSANAASNHWIYSGAYTSFQDYRFATRARLNLLPTRSVAKRARRIREDICPRCHGAPETLAHILNACPPNAGLMRERHNKILQRVVKAIPTSLGECYVEQKVSGSPSDLRPDIVVINRGEKKAIIADVTVPFESSREALNAARQEKIRKYTPLAEWMKADLGLETSVLALVVGSLGSWDNDNLPTLRALGIGKNYSVLFRKLCVSDAISGSRSIWTLRSSRRQN